MSTVEKPRQKPKPDRGPRRGLNWFSKTRKDRPAKRNALPPATVPPYRRNTIHPFFLFAAYATLAVLCLLYGASFGMNAPRLMVVFAIPIALVVVLGIWALPSGDYAPTGAVRWLFFAFFAALILWPNYLAIALPGLPWITLIRLTGVPLMLTMLVCASVSKQFRQDLGAVLAADPWVPRLLLAFVAVQAATLVFSKSPGTSLNRFLVAQLNWTAIFFAACYVFRRPGAVQAWARIFLIAGGILCAIGIVEARQGVVLWAGHIPSFLKIGDESVLKSLAGMARAFGSIAHRVQATSSTPLGPAEYLGLTMPLALHFVIAGKSPIERAACAVYIPLAVYVIVLTDSRLGIVASLLSPAFYLFFWGVRRWRTRQADVIAPAVVLSYPAFFCLFIAATFFVGRLRASVWGSGAEQASTDSRKIQWATGMPKVWHAPWGHGQGRSAEVLGYYAMDGTLTIDSYFLGLLLDYGFLGFTLYLAFFLRSAWTGGSSAFRSRSKDTELLIAMPLAVSILNFIVIKAVFSQEDNHPIAYMMAAGCLALAYRSRLETARETPAPPSGRSSKTVGKRLRA